MNLKKLTALSIVSIMMAGATAFAVPQPQKIAVIDVQKVVSASTQVKALKKSQEAKNKEIQNFIKSAQADIAKQTTDKNKKSMTEKYEKQLKARKEANAKEYTTKLKEADASITAQIGQQARAMGYTMVLPKSSVVFGGDDITEAMLKVIK